MNLEGFIVLVSLLLVYVALYTNNSKGDNDSNHYMHSLLLLIELVIMNYNIEINFITNMNTILSKKVIVLLPVLTVLLFTANSNINTSNIIHYNYLNTILIYFINNHGGCNYDYILKRMILLFVIITMISNISIVNISVSMIILLTLVYSKVLELLSSFEQSLYLTLLQLIIQYIIFNSISSNDDIYSESTCLTIVFVGLFCVLLCGIVITLIINNTNSKSNQNILVSITIVASIGLMLVWMNMVLSLSPLIWIVRFLLFDNNSIENSYHNVYLCLYWIIMILISIFITHQSTGAIPQICVRKIFHFTAVFMFAPFIHIKRYRPFLVLAFGVALCIFIVIEYIRVYLPDMHPLIGNVSKFYANFIDSRENPSQFLLSHIYLLVGIALPVWLDSVQNSYHHHHHHHHSISTILPHLGWISIGIGDSMGAVMGTYIGKNKWRGRSRTLEGSLSMLVSMIVSLTLANSYFVNTYFVIIIVASILTTLMEAFTSENDNLLLPLHYCTLLGSLFLIVGK